MNSHSVVNQQEMHWWLSWPAIVIICILFWPLGIFLIWKRTTMDKKAAMNAGKSMSIIGWILLVLGFLILIGGLSEPVSDTSGIIVDFIIFIGGGLALIILGAKRKKEAVRFKKYIDMVINQRITSIDNIAASFPTTYDIANKDLQKMIKKGFFMDAFINQSEREIVLPHEQQNIKNDQSQGYNAGEMQIVNCKSCGAHNKLVKGSVGECEYCGSPIKCD
jgi:succinate dehydrogenase hydrophobic anchor subunit